MVTQDGTFNSPIFPFDALKIMWSYYRGFIMKKFLLLLVSVLFTLSSFGQGSLNLEHLSGTIDKVGDEFVLKIQYYTVTKEISTLIQFDYEYNKLLEITDFT